MFIDGHLELSDAQAITASAASEDIIDFETDFIGAGMELPIHCAVTTTLVTAGLAGTLTINFHSSDDSTFATYTDHWETAALAEATLVAGTLIELPPVPKNTDRYGRLYYTVAGGPFTAGALDAAVVLSKQTNNYDKVDAFGALVGE